MNERLQHYIKMSKLRIVFMVLITCSIGFFLGSREAGSLSWLDWLLCLVGTGMAAAGAASLNNYIERDIDARMARTRDRALPSGAVEPLHALTYGILMVLGGLVVLVANLNLLAAFLVLLTAFLYVLVYTPLKRLTWWNTSIGAIPGALPPVSGWAAATGNLDAGAWALFAILFIWQHPHFYAIAWMYRDDYRDAGFRMLSVVDPTGNRLFRHVIGSSIALLIAAAVPTWLGMTGWIYFTGAVALGTMMLWVGRQGYLSHSVTDARRLLRASVYYLPALLAFIVVDVIW
jgi:heme o synthase